MPVGTDSTCRPRGSHLHRDDEIPASGEPVPEPDSNCMSMIGSCAGVAPRRAADLRVLTRTVHRVAPEGHVHIPPPQQSWIRLQPPSMAGCAPIVSGMTLAVPGARGFVALAQRAVIGDVTRVLSTAHRSDGGLSGGCNTAGARPAPRRYERWFADSSIRWPAPTVAGQRWRPGGRGPAGAGCLRSWAGPGDEPAGLGPRGEASMLTSSRATSR